MSKQFVRLAADIVIANSTGKGFSAEQLTQMLKECPIPWKNWRWKLEEWWQQSPLLLKPAIPADWKASIGKDKITCMICGYIGKILTPHLKSKHKTTPKEYRKQFAILPGHP